MNSVYEAIYTGVAIICFIGSALGWFFMLGGMLGNPEDDTSMPRDAEWLDRVPPWLQLVTIGVVIILLFEIIRASAHSTLLP